MTDHNDTIRETGNIEQIAAGLRKARKKRRISLDKASAQLRLPIGTLEALEGGRIDELGPIVYVRGYITNYARLLGAEVPSLELPAVGDPEMDRAPVIAIPSQVGKGRRLIDQYAKMASYVVATVVLIVPIVWWGGIGILDRMGLGNPQAESTQTSAPLQSTVADRSAQTNAAGQSSGLSANNQADSSAEEVSRAEGPLGETPLMASMTSLPRTSSSSPASSSDDPPAVQASTPLSEQVADLQQAVATDTQQTPVRVAGEGEIAVQLSLSGDSWIEIVAADGARLEYDLLRGGSDYHYVGEAPLRAVIGNAAAVTLWVDGEALDITPYQSGNLARLQLPFAVREASEPGSNDDAIAPQSEDGSSDSGG